jgi:hypothetical protein
MTTMTLTRKQVDRLQEQANQALLEHDWPTLERLVGLYGRTGGRPVSRIGSSVRRCDD